MPPENTQPNWVLDTDDDSKRTTAGATPNWVEDTGEEEAAKPASATPTAPSPKGTNDFKEKGIWNTLKSAFDTSKDPEARAMMQSMSAAGGAISNTALEALKRFATLGKEGLGSEEWKKTLQGNASPVSETLQKKFGWGPISSHIVGLPANALADMAGGNLLGGGMEKEAGPIGQALQGAGKRVYRAPFHKVDAELATKYKGPASRHLFTDQLWNEGKPTIGGFTKNNPQIGEEITNARKATGKSIGDTISEAGGDSEINVAPNLRENIKAKMPEPEVVEAELTPEQLKAVSFLPPEVQESAKAKMRTQAAVPAEAPDELEWLKGRLASKNKGARAEAISILAESAPDLSGVIRDNAKHLANSGSRPGIISFYNGLIDDLAEGPRSLEALQDLKVSMQNLAARNQQMGANQYARNALPNQAKTAEMHAADNLGTVIDEMVDQHLGSDAAKLRNADKARYSALRRGEVPAWRAVQTQENRPALSKLDLLMGLLGANQATSHPGAITAAIGAKALDEIRKSPRLGTGTGMLLNKAGKSNIWDTMLRRGLLNSLKP